MSEVVEKVSELNSAQSKEAAALPTKTVADVTINNVEAAIKAVPEAENDSSAATENADKSGLKEAVEKASPKVENKKSPVKRTPSKRMSFIERAQKESEELVKNMGGSLEIEGGRKTRSSTRGTPTRSAVTSSPPPTKKVRASPASGASTPTRPRGRGRKLDVTDDAAAEEVENKATPSRKKTPAKGKKTAAKEAADDEEEIGEKPEETKVIKKKSPEKEENVADKSNDETASSVATKKATGVAEQPEEDATDAPVETVVEETQSQAEADVLPTELNVTKEPENESAPAKIDSAASESVKSASPMETEDAKIDEIVTKEAIKATTENAKEPTPEPMEIDSSPSVNNDVVEIEDVVELSDEVELVEESAKMGENQQSTAEHSKINNIEKAGENIKENSVVPSADSNANKSIAKTPTEVANTNDTATHGTNDSNKSENNLCEPKIATSPPISAANDNSTVTTPQTCN